MTDPGPIPLKSRADFSIVLKVFFFLAALIALVAGSPSLRVTFLSILIEALPFMLIGSVLSGLMEVYWEPSSLFRHLSGKPLLAAFMGGGIGLFFPVCECASVPVVRRLLRKGAPLSGAIAFLLAGPLLNPVAILSTGTSLESPTNNPLRQRNTPL